MNHKKQNNNQVIINRLKKEVYDLQIYTEENEITLRYSIRNSLVKKKKWNDFYYKGESEKEIKGLAEKPQMKIFEILAHKHLEKNTGYSKVPKTFKTPCYLCNQQTLTTYGWSKESNPDNLERFFCRLCQTSFGWIDIKDDPVELQQEMANYYLTFTQKDIEEDEERQVEILEELNHVRQSLTDKRQLLENLKGKLLENEPTT